VKTFLIWLVIFVIGSSLWFWFIYPTYLDVSECSTAVKESIQSVANERNKKVYEAKADTCQIEGQALIELSNCYNEKKESGLVPKVMIWYPPFLFEQQNLRKQHEAQCLDSSPLFIDR